MSESGTSRASPPRFRWRRLPQYGLQTLLILTTLLCVWLGGWIELRAQSPSASKGGAPVAVPAPAARLSPESLPPGVLFQLGNSRIRAPGLVVPEAFSPDGRFLLAGGMSAVWIWSVGTGELVKTLPVANGLPMSGWFTGPPHEFHFFSDHGLNQYTHSRWRYPDWTPLGSESSGDREPDALLGEARGHRRRVAPGRNHSLQVLDSEGVEEFLTVREEGRLVYPQLSPDEKLLLIASIDKQSQDNRFELWDIDGRRKRFEWQTDGAVKHNMVVTPDGAFLIAGADKHDLRCWDLKTGKEVSRLENKDFLTRPPEMSPDGKRVAVAIPRGIKVFEVPTGKELQSLKIPNNASSLVFSPDGNLLATGGMGSSVLAFDLRTGHELFARPDHTAGIRELALSEDGGRLISVDFLGKIVAWDLRQRQPFAECQPKADITGVSISADGRLAVLNRRITTPLVWKLDGSGSEPTAVGSPPPPIVVAASLEERAFVVAQPNGSLAFGSAPRMPLPPLPRSGPVTPQIAFRGHVGAVLSVAVSADATTVASLGEDRTLRIWKPGSVDETAKIPVSETSHPRLALAGDGSLVAAAVGRSLRVWKSTGNGPTATITLDDEATVLRFARDAKTLLVGTFQGNLVLFETATGKELRRQRAHNGGVSAIELSRNGSVVYSAGRDGTVASWKSDLSAKVASIDEKLAPILCICPLPDGQHLVAGDEKGALVVSDLTQGKRVQTWQRDEPARSIVVSADGNQLALLNGLGGLDYFDLARNAPIKWFTLLRSPMADETAATISADGKQIALAIPSAIRIRPAQDADHCTDRATSASYARCMAFSPSGKLLAAGGHGLCVWKLDGLTPVLEIPQARTGLVTRLLFSPDSRLLVSGGVDKDVNIWDLESGKSAGVIPLDVQSFFDQFHFSRDGRLLVGLIAVPGSGSSSALSSLAVWEVAGGKPLGDALRLPTTFSSAAVSQDDRQMILGLHDGRIWVCDLPDFLKKVLPAVGPPKLQQ